MNGATSHPDGDGDRAAGYAGPLPSGDRDHAADGAGPVPDRDHVADGAGRAPDPAPVLAAGCVLWRRSPYDGGPEICLVHRPKYDDWSFPKGKLKRGEAALDGALREVLEETGHHCTPGTRLPTSRYVVNGRPKEVAYWAAEATSGAFAPNDEVDRLAWLSPTAARNRLTRPRDRDQLEAALPDLLRHA